MAILTAQVPTSSGVLLNAVTPEVGGDKVPVGSKVRVQNESAGVVTFTMTTHAEYDGDLPIDDRVETIPDGEAHVFLADGKYRNPTDGLVDILSDTTTGVTFEVTI